MSYANPNPLIIDAPVGIDAPIARIQNLLSSLPWLTCAYGRATIGQETIAGSEEIFPEVYQGTNDYLRLTPNNFLAAQSYVQLEGPGKPMNYSLAARRTWQYPIGLVVICNLETIKKESGYNYNYRFTEILKNEILDALRFFPQFAISNISENPQDVFRGYSYDHTKYQTFRHPEAGYKFSGVLTFDDICIPTKPTPPTVRLDYFQLEFRETF